MSNIETVAITDEQKWLETRLKDVTSTEASALYELNPYQTVFELFHAKKNQEVIRIEENERMSWGKRLEQSIAEGAAESMGWDVEPLNVYMRNPETRMGSSFDYQINNHELSIGIETSALLFINPNGLTMAPATLRPRNTSNCKCNTKWKWPTLTGVQL